jgi:hypothetical protein
MWTKARSAVLLSLFCLSVCGTAAAQDDAAKALLATHRGAIVQIQVRGKINNKPAFENGTGFLFQTAAGPRIITAGHVIGPDNKWDSLVDRCIYYRLAQNGSSLQYDCVVDARIDPTLDIAEIYLDPFDAPTLEMAQSLPTNGAELAVTSWRSWGQPGSRATAQSSRILDLQSEKMILSGNYERSDSGSPVLDSKGRVVGLMIEASNQPGSTTQGTAIPVTLFSSILTGAIASPVRRTPVPLLAKVDKGHIIVDASDVVAMSGCVFLGKRSASVTRRAPDMPFGLSILQTLLNSGTRESIVGKSLAAETAVNLRSDCPTIVDGSAYYAAPRAQMTPGDEFTPREILALRYLDDVFFWARGLAQARTGSSNVK